MVCYVVAVRALNYWQVGRQQELNAVVRQHPAIRRDFNRPRGPILTPTAP